MLADSQRHAVVLMSSAQSSFYRLLFITYNHLSFSNVSPLPASILVPPLSDDTMSCFFYKSGKMRFSGCKKSFSVKQPNLYFFLAWGSVVVPVMTRMGDLQICISLSNKGDPKLQSKIALKMKKYY